MPLKAVDLSQAPLFYSGVVIHVFRTVPFSNMLGLLLGTILGWLLGTVLGIMVVVLLGTEVYPIVQEPRQSNQELPMLLQKPH